MHNRPCLQNFISLSIICFFITVSPSHLIAQADTGDQMLKWYSDFETAKKVAGANGKNVMLYFSGSDWCEHCVQLNNTVLDTETFSNYAKGNFVPVKLDFPKMRKKKTHWKKEVPNKDLATKFNPNGVFPLLVFLDQNDEMIGFTGFADLSPNIYVSIIKKILHR